MRGHAYCKQCDDIATKLTTTKVVPKKNGTTRVLGLDQSSHITGWSMYDGHELIKYGTFIAPDREDIERFDAVKN
jgi:hypothetical protein